MSFYLMKRRKMLRNLIRSMSRLILRRRRKRMERLTLIDLFIRIYPNQTRST